MKASGSFGGPESNFVSVYLGDRQAQRFVLVLIHQLVTYLLASPPRLLKSQYSI